MLLKRNLLESVTIISCSGTVICILLNYITNISPITGIWFHLYILILFLVAVSCSFKFIQWLLRLNKPVKYDLEKLVVDYPQLSFLSKILPPTANRVKSPECKEYDTNELSVISTVLERKLVSSWYMPYISQEIGFPFACKQMLDQMIGKTFQICNKIETKDVFVDICIVLVNHFKEYKKALKRQEKFPTNSIESLYKKSHPISDNKCESTDHCTFILRIILKELIPWELWDTPHSELLVRILSKKLDNFIDNTLADPIWLNDKLLTILHKRGDMKEEKEKTVKETELVETAPIQKEPSPITVDEVVKEPVIKEEILDTVDELVVSSTEPVDIKSSPVLRQRRGRQGRNEVKIYDRIVEGTVKTWDTDIDLQCISLGQDLLASLDGEITLSRLWGQEDADGSPNPPRSKSPQPLWFGEEDIDLDLDTSPQKEAKKEQSPKPGDALLKDLQTTVHQAKTKIGDLQVQANVNLDVSRKQYSSDEAAGMMEGLLDFGIAGLKKGLRFTGLSDDSQEKLLLHHREKINDKTPPSELTRAKEQQTATVAVLHKEENGPNSAPPLVKQHRVISQDSVPSQPKSIPPPLPLPLSPPLELPLAESPEPEYEEAADLSTSIAKLRCLLQQRQRPETSPPAREDIWWESAEETRGRTHHHHSTRPVDTATLADEYDMNVERNTSPGQTSNNMQRLDKLFQRTVTGVFNSIKTAVGAEGEGEEASSRPLHDWTYVCTSMELSVCGAVSRVVGGRRALGHVDAALDSLHQLGHKHPEPLPPPEDFEEWCAQVGAGWSGVCEVSVAAGLAHKHVTHRIATLLFADLAESLLTIWLEELATWIRQQVFVVFEQLSRHEDPCFTRDQDLMEFHLDQTCEAIMQKVPLLQLFGEETLSSAVKLVISSFSHKQLNKDVAFRTLDLLTNHFNKSAALRNPSFDAN